MTRSIKWRMVSIFVLLVVIVMIASGSLIVYQTRKYEYDFIKEELVNTGNTFAEGVFTDVPITEIEVGIEEMLDDLEVSLKDKKIFILDRKGNVVITQSVATKETRFYTSQVMAALSNESHKVTEFDELHLYGEEVTYIGYAQSIIKDDHAVFVVYIVSSTAQVQDKIRNMVGVIMVAILLAIVLSIILAFLFSAFLTKPISALTAKAREMARGQLDNPIHVFSNDEIGELTVNFNRMASSLNDTLAQIASEKNKMETVITHMTDGILVFDNFGLLIHNNPASVRMLKMNNVLSFQDVFKDTLKVDFDTLVSKVETETTKSTLMMGEAYYSVDFAKYLDKDGVTKGLICVIQDITEHKKLEKMQKEFVANVSHELRTPLTTIKSYTETLLEGAVDDLNLASQFLNVINSESDRMTALVQDLLELSKLDNQKTAFDKSSINLSTLLFDSVENYRIHARKKSQDLTMEGVNDSYYILGDSNRVEQVIKNILSNAVKYSGEEAIVKVKLETNSIFHIVSVKDTGMGIPEDDLPHIFDRFYRVDKARSRAMGGTGLGLAIAKEIMELHGGKITAESKVNEGTTFYLYFPVYQQNVIQ